MKKHLLWGALLLSLAAPANAALVFNTTFTSNFNTDFGANAAAAQAAFNAAAANLASFLVDDITINLTVDAVAGTSILGQSNTSIFSVNYAALYNATLADATSADDATVTGAGGSLGGNGTANSATDPVGSTHNWWATRAQIKALNLGIGGVTAHDSTNDGTITFGAGFSYTFSGPIAPGTIDFQGVAAHEISEVMGRIGLSGSSVAGSPAYTLLDALSFSGAGTRVLGNGANANFSMDLGTSLLMAFNNQALNGGDSRDWASGSNDAFNAFSTSGVQNPVTATDLRLMDVIGYNTSASAVPEPATVSMLFGGLAVIFAGRRSRR